jgi:mRNA-degrading endonuclease toxin of MazEF toxin-antitoxin module
MSDFGTIIEMRLPEHRPRAHEQEGLRPCVFVFDPSTMQKVTFPQLWVIPITSTYLPEGATRLRLEDGDGGLAKGGTALLDQMRAVDLSRLRQRHGKLSGDRLEKLREAVKAMFDKALEV